MPVEYTPEEKRVLARLFPDELLSKLVTTIRDAILTSEKFAAAVRAVKAKAIFGVEPEKISGAIVAMVDEAVRRHQPDVMSEQEFLERLKAKAAARAKAAKRAKAQPAGPAKSEETQPPAAEEKPGEMKPTKAAGGAGKVAGKPSKPATKPDLKARVSAPPD